MCNLPFVIYERGNKFLYNKIQYICRFIRWMCVCVLKSKFEKEILNIEFITRSTTIKLKNAIETFSSSFISWNRDGALEALSITVNFLTDQS